MRYCPDCGAQISDDAVFCTNCGKKTEVPSSPEAAPAGEPVRPAAPAFQAAASAPREAPCAQRAANSDGAGPAPNADAPYPAMGAAPVPPPPPPPEAYPAPARRTDPPPPEGSRYNPISAWGYVGIFLLLSVPVVGLVFTIVWACGGCRKVNKRNLARGVLLLYLIAVIIFVIAGIVAVAVTGSALWTIFGEMSYIL
ncbi:MAG: zinc-ribbon domain-containing protein [Eubacteriales bacterium]